MFRPVAALLITLIAWPQAAQAGEAGDRERLLQGKIAREEQHRERRRFHTARARLSHPQRLSAGFGFLWASPPAEYDCRTTCDLEGFLLQLEPGLNGGQLSAGYALVISETGPRRRFLAPIYMGLAIKGALLRTWGDADLDDPSQTLAGAEVEFTITRFNFSVGLFRGISPDSDEGWTLTGGLGWGF